MPITASNGVLSISCRNWHCPKCQAQARQRWLAAREQELLGVTYRNGYRPIWRPNWEGNKSRYIQPGQRATPQLVKPQSRVGTLNPDGQSLIGRRQPRRNIRIRGGLKRVGRALAVHPD